MLTQQMTSDEQSNQGTLTITCVPGSLAELIGLMEELRLRPNIHTAGTVVVMAQDAPPLG